MTSNPGLYNAQKSFNYIDNLKDFKKAENYIKNKTHQFKHEMYYFSRRKGSRLSEYTNFIPKPMKNKWKTYNYTYHEHYSKFGVKKFIIAAGCVQL